MTRALSLLACALYASACSPEIEVGGVERCLLGAHADPESGETREHALESTDALAGRRLDLDRQYHFWEDDLIGDYERWSAGQGRVLALSFTGRHRDGSPPVRWAEVADPANEPVQAHLAEIAQQLAAFDARVFLTFQQQPEDDVPEYGTTEDFVAAWRRIADVVRGAGASRVELVWTIGSGVFAGEADAWYPGDAYVDWIGATGFNWYTGAAAPWRSFAMIFVGVEQWSAPHGKPLQLLTGSVESGSVDPLLSKARWLMDIVPTLHEWTNVQALLLLDDGDFRLDTSPETADAFRALASDPYFDVRR